MFKRALALALGALALSPAVSGLGGEKCVIFPHEHLLQPLSLLSKATSLAQTILGRSSTSTPRPFLIVSKYHGATPLVLDSEDDEAIHVAAHFFAADVERVTGTKPKIYNGTLPRGTERAIVVGSTGSGLVRAQHPSWTGEMEGRWEVWDLRVVSGEQVGGVKEALMVTGSNRRGVIYGLYELSEQMGVSPWYWWADVPAVPRSTIAFDPTKICSHGEPTVKYRGLFINDELPVLWNWARETFEVPLPQTPFQVGMYERVFELLLRLKANYMWPAMWASMFDVDGLNPQANGLPKSPIPGPNQDLANRMGIVMGSSHHEPMARNKEEWDLEGEGAWDWTNKEKLTSWWEYGAERAKGQETLFTLGMRGDGDSPLTGGNAKLVEEVAGVQRDLLRKVYNTSDISHIPQMWCMYKEVQGYFQEGLEVPDDVTIMFADDNWGNMMAVLPAGSEHTGGSGLYYHAEYVGRPRDYKWINTISLAKMWEQLNIAQTFNMTQVWILNVGDLKLTEIPLNYFLSIAYDGDMWQRNSVTPWLKAWAAREFGEEVADEVAHVMGTFSRYVSRIKPELLNSTLWSLENYEEAERLLEDWTDLEERSEKVYHKLNKPTRTAYFELVHAVVKLMANLNRLYIAVGKNNMYAEQARTSTNMWAQKAINYFNMDGAITQQYHELLDGRWDHMLDQTHINFNWWAETERNTMPPVSFIETFSPSRPSREALPKGLPAYYRVSVENSRGAWPGVGKHNCRGGYECWSPNLVRMDPFGKPTRWVDLSSGGPKDVEFTLTPNISWINTDITHGRLQRDAGTDTRFYVSIDWSKVPKKDGEEPYSTGGGVLIAGSDGTNVTLGVPITTAIPPPDDFQGFVEGDGYVVMEAAHFARNESASGYAFEDIEWYGRTLSGLEMLPVSNVNHTLGTGPSLSYDFWSTGASGNTKNVEVTIQIGPTFNFMLGKKLAFGLQVDDGEARMFTPIPDTTEVEGAGTVPADWPNIVSSEIRNVTGTFELGGGGAGEHSVTVYGITSGIIVERIWVDFAGIVERGYSYLGPPESRRV